MGWEQLKVIQERLGTPTPSPISSRRHDILNIKAKIAKHFIIKYCTYFLQLCTVRVRGKDGCKLSADSDAGEKLALTCVTQLSGL